MNRARSRAVDRHTHAGLEELFLFDGELWIDDRKRYPGDYNRAEAPSGDKRVWSETGCTCVLFTSTRDILGSSGKLVYRHAVNPTGEVIPLL
jgi:anti-sigma factor ChrR (cupin superfamily)